jgi:hypothetical protein
MKFVNIFFLSTYIIALFFNIQAILAVPYGPHCPSTTTVTETTTTTPTSTITETTVIIINFKNLYLINDLAHLSSFSILKSIATTEASIITTIFLTTVTTGGCPGPTTTSLAAAAKATTTSLPAKVPPSTSTPKVVPKVTKVLPKGPAKGAKSKVVVHHHVSKVSSTHGAKALSHAKTSKVVTVTKKVTIHKVKHVSSTPKVIHIKTTTVHHHAPKTVAKAKVVRVKTVTVSKVAKAGGGGYYKE